MSEGKQHEALRRKRLTLCEFSFLNYRFQVKMP
jgi:hypothetical protein